MIPKPHAPEPELPELSIRELHERLFDRVFSGEEFPEVTVSVIVLSYNRPRMLTEALRSIKGADHVVLLDDGSDFDIWDLAARELARFPSSELRVAPKMPVEDRLKTARLGGAINRALVSSPCPVVTYLCDDDLFHPDWIRAVRSFFQLFPDEHVVRARWGVFRDGDEPGRALCPLPPRVELTTGNFAHTTSCSREHDVLWDETTIGSHDGSFVPRIFASHPLNKIRRLGMMAGWRREHDWNMLKYVKGAGYADGAEKVLSRGALE